MNRDERHKLRKIGLWILLASVLIATVSIIWVAFEASLVAGFITSSICGMIIGCVLYEAEF